MYFLWILAVLIIVIVGYIAYIIYKLSKPSSNYNSNSRIEVIIHLLGWTPTKVPYKYEPYEPYEPYKSVEPGATIKEGIRHRWVESRMSSLQMGQNELV